MIPRAIQSNLRYHLSPITSLSRYEDYLWRNRLYEMVTVLIRTDDKELKSTAVRGMPEL